MYGYGGRAGNHQFDDERNVAGIMSADVEKRIAEREADEADS